MYVHIFFNVGTRLKIWIETSNQQMAITRVSWAGFSPVTLNISPNLAKQ